MPFNNQRKHFFINKSLQTRYIAYIAGTLSIVSIASALCIYFGIWSSVLKDFSEDSIKHRLEFSTRLREYSDARTFQEAPEKMTLALIKEIELFSNREKEILSVTLSSTYKQLFPLFFALLFFIGWGSIFITHKIAGPLFRLESSFKQISKGHLNFRIHLRKFDEGQSLVPFFNQFLEGLDHAFFQMKEAALSLTKLMKEKSFPVEALELLAQINYELDRYQTTQTPSDD